MPICVGNVCKEGVLGELLDKLLCENGPACLKGLEVDGGGIVEDGGGGKTEDDGGKTPEDEGGGTANNDGVVEGDGAVANDGVLEGGGTDKTGGGGGIAGVIGGTTDRDKGAG